MLPVAVLPVAVLPDTGRDGRDIRTRVSPIAAAGTLAACDRFELSLPPGLGAELDYRPGAKGRRHQQQSDTGVWGKQFPHESHRVHARVAGTATLERTVRSRQPYSRCLVQELVGYLSSRSYSSATRSSANVRTSSGLCRCSALSPNSTIIDITPFSYQPRLCSVNCLRVVRTGRYRPRTRRSVACEPQSSCLPRPAAVDTPKLLRQGCVCHTSTRGLPLRKGYQWHHPLI